MTFTNKAAREMRERVEILVGTAAAQGMWIGTFHSLCGRLLRSEGAAIGIASNFVIYDSADQLSTLRTLLKKRNVDEKVFRPAAILGAISKAKERLLSPSEFRSIAIHPLDQIAADLFAEYEEELRRANALDFDDLLVFAYRLLEGSPEVRTKYQERFLHVLVDEYQDVNLAQYLIVQTLGAKHRNVVVVGDDDQSIYGWRGADVALILRFSADYPDAKVVKLERNYRSTKTILAGANAVIQHNQGRAGKNLWTENSEGALIKLIEAGSEHDEAALVLDAIQREVNAGRRRYGDFAVLYRMNAQSRVLEEAFLGGRIPHLLLGGTRFYQRKEVKEMLSYLRLTHNPRDDASFRRVYNAPSRGIGTTSLGIIEARAAQLDVPLLDVITDQELQG
ncbi:MAG: ATP-dependent DNA helicase PcrA, partial [Armatimonadota bacterium]